MRSTTAPWHRNVGLLAGLTLFLALTYSFAGAFDTDDLGFGHRLLLWTLIGALMVGQPVLIERAVSRATPVSTPWHLASMAAAILLAVPLMSLELHLLKFTPLLPKEPDPWTEFIPFVAPPVMTVAGFVLFLRLSWERLHLEDERPDAGTAGDGESPASRWIDERTLFVHAQDHYLEIVSAHGRRFVRGRLADLEDDRLAGLGLRTHRSWWAADRAVAGARRDGRDVSLLLTTGDRIPVARARLTAVRERGWLDRSAADAEPARLPEDANLGA